MLRIISERTLDVEEELCECLVDWQKLFDPVNWTKLVPIVKGTGVDWRDRRLVTKFYMDQNMKNMDQGETLIVKIGRGIRRRCSLIPIYSTCTANTFSRMTLTGLETSKEKDR
jgi:hypothetical protein